MELYDFNRLTQEQREKLVWEQGEFIAARQSCGCYMCLYSLGKLFAEVVYLENDNRIILIRGFTSKIRLDPYLEMVSLSDIMM